MTQHLVEMHINPITQMSVGIYGGDNEDYSGFWTRIYALWLEIRPLSRRLQSQFKKAVALEELIDSMPKKISDFKRTHAEERNEKKAAIIEDFRSIMKSMWARIIASQIFWQFRPEIPEMTKDDVAKAIPLGLKAEVPEVD